jgi:hypothetical protein
MSDAVLEHPAPFRFPSQQQIAAALLRGWILILLGIALGVWSAANDLRATSYQYRAQMQVTQAQSNSGGGLSTTGGLAALATAGFPLGQNGDEFRLYLDSLKTRDIADELAKDPVIMHTLFASEWDQASQSWHEPPPPTGTDAWIKRIEDWLGFPSVTWHAPDGESLEGVLGQIVNIEQDPRRIYVATVSVTYYDPQFALKLLNILHKAADNALRQKSIRRTTDYIAFLNNLLSKVTVVEHRTAIAQALSDQEKAAMIAQSGSAYAAEPFERPWVGTSPVSPKPMQSLAQGAFLGALLGSLLALLKWGTAARVRATFKRLTKRRVLRPE